MLAFFAAFAGPITNLINTGIASGSAAFVTYAVAKGMDVSTASLIAISAAGIAASGVQMGAAMLGVKIKVINDGNNGIKVVPEGAPAPMVDAALK
jgi:hypothetical protein